MTARPETRVFNPAFDVTPAALITAIVTEEKVLLPPLDRSLADLPGLRRK
jgi:methylthioribose-1-phosphate isomerase